MERWSDSSSERHFLLSALEKHRPAFSASARTTSGLKMKLGGLTSGGLVFLLTLIKLEIAVSHETGVPHSHDGEGECLSTLDLAGFFQNSALWLTFIHFLCGHGFISVPFHIEIS